MKVTIVEIDAGQSVSVPGTTQLGHPARFRAPSVEGPATLVLRTGREPPGPGEVLDVDAKHAYISHFAELREPTAPRVEPLADAGDYRVEGPVMYRYDSGDFGVESGGFIFTLHRDDARGALPEPRRWVSFRLHGLSLWERG